MFFVIVLSLCLLHIPEVWSLECYACDSGWTNQLCTQKTTTCQSDELCSNTLERKQFEGRLFTKGCMERQLCYDLQSLNDRKTCRDTPSVCVYCCDSTLCNQGETTRVFFPILLLSIVIVLV
ncbi:hypothetical protein SNE40_016884 [Patella caerulea]|uniref:UPAR/Ly6 domain-containing protein n=1 Tax=Patella caerulea TaxID=87958 RepID=A0AAN8J9C8_PATCE